MTVPSLIGFSVEEARQAAESLGLAVVVIDAPPEHWLPEHRVVRVCRQQLRPDGVLELLSAQVPALPPA